MLAAGGEVWVTDETALREFPPLRAGWSKRGAPARVVISGRTQRRTILGALHATTGERVRTAPNSRGYLLRVPFKTGSGHGRPVA